MLCISVEEFLFWKKKQLSKGGDQQSFEVLLVCIGGISTSYLNFKILNPKKNSRGNRKFTHKDIEAINKIYFLLKEKGYTIQGAKHYINNEKTSDKLDIVNKLKLIKDKLIEIRNQL